MNFSLKSSGFFNKNFNIIWRSKKLFGSLMVYTSPLYKKELPNRPDLCKCSLFNGLYNGRGRVWSWKLLSETPVKCLHTLEKSKVAKIEVLIPNYSLVKT